MIRGMPALLARQRPRAAAVIIDGMSVSAETELLARGLFPPDKVPEVLEIRADGSI